MGVNRPAEHHYVRRRPPREAEATRWVELADAAGRPFWLDAGLWLRPVPLRAPADLPSSLAPVLSPFAADPVTKAGAGAPASIRFVHEALFYELFPSSLGHMEGSFGDHAPAIVKALLLGGCPYAEWMINP